MSDGEWALIGVTIAIPLAVAIVIVVAHRVVRARCPECTAPLVLDVRNNNHAGVVWGSPGARMFRCKNCGTEYRRENRGALISKTAWDAGARVGLPRATLVRGRR